MLITSILLIYILGCIFAYFNIKHHNALCDISKQLEEAKMSVFSLFASWFYFLVEHHTFGVGEIPDDENHAPDDENHFNDHLFETK